MADELTAIQDEIDLIREATSVEWHVLETEVLPPEERRRRLAVIDHNNKRLWELVDRKWQLEAERV